mmetsp:Transcript_12737/g.40400  ORF Transcript_12737/g.40400 Transcript_12737/m.40400 type:complete len:431 (-) Transcript_12737:8-1300(-)
MAERAGPVPRQGASIRSTGRKKGTNFSLANRPRSEERFAPPWTNSRRRAAPPKRNGRRPLRGRAAASEASLRSLAAGRSSKPEGEPRKRGGGRRGARQVRLEGEARRSGRGFVGRVGNPVGASHDAREGPGGAAMDKDEAVVEVDPGDAVPPDGMRRPVATLVVLEARGGVPVVEHRVEELGDEGGELGGGSAVALPRDARLAHDHRVEVLDGVDGTGSHAGLRGPEGPERRVDHLEGVTPVVDDDVERAVLGAHLAQESGVELRADLDGDVLLLDLAPLAERVDVDPDVPQVVAVVLVPDPRRSARLDPNLQQPHRLAHASPAAGRGEVPLVVRRVLQPVVEHRLLVVPPVQLREQPVMPSIVGDPGDARSRLDLGFAALTLALAPLALLVAAAPRPPQRPHCRRQQHASADHGSCSTLQTRHHRFGSG